MTASLLGSVLRRLRDDPLLEGQTDGQLLERFAGVRDEAAFAALLGRHGGMVLGVCRRVLGNEADAEDAFQATFLVLATKAAVLSGRAVLGDWLHGVARHTALKARAMSQKRRAKERQAAPPRPADEGETRERLGALDEEIARLPRRYRRALVLCDLEGTTIRDAARRLGCPQGTVASRLHRARALLAGRLARRGLALSAGALTAVGVPAAVAASTVKAASLGAAGPAAAAAGVISAEVAALTQEVLKAMFAVRITSVLATLLLAFAVAAGVAAGNATPTPQPEKRTTAAPEPAITVADPTKKLAPAEPPKLDRAGVVKAIRDEQVLIDIGADKGLKRDDILEVYRLGPPPLYCGRIRLVAVTPHEAVGVPVQPTARIAKIQVNDRVARKILAE